jgi:hypothetical protein
MRAISTVTFKRTLVRWASYFIIFMAILLATALAFAKPPQALSNYILTRASLQHDGHCNVKQMNMVQVPCLIFYEKEHNIIWLVLFDKDKDGRWNETHVLADKDGQLVSMWCRSDVCT